MTDRALATPLARDHAGQEALMLCDSSELLALGGTPQIRDVLVGTKVNDKSVHGSFFLSF